ncbi:MAG: EAL domain-containing protein [Synergistaceae bacterium]|nr:EAL domain-containing protein [Synergistaceae bacterium]
MSAKLLLNKYHDKKAVTLRVLAAVALIAIAVAVFSGWQLRNEHSRFSEISNRHIAISENIERIISYNEVLRMSARLCAATGDFSLEERYNQFNIELAAAINGVRNMSASPAIESFIGEIDEANTALVKTERQAFMLTHQGRGQEALTLLNSNEYAGLKGMYADGIQKTISAGDKLIQSDTDYMNHLYFKSTAAYIIGILILFFACFFAVWSTRILKTGQGYTEDTEGCHGDTAEDKQATENQSNYEKKFRTLYDSTSDAVMFLYEDDFIDCNRAARVLFGCADCGKTGFGNSATLLQHQQPCSTNSMMQLKGAAAAAVEEGKNQFEWVYKKNDTGESLTVKVSLTAVELEGKPAVQVIVRDITERKQIEEDLLESQEYARTLFSSSHIPLVVMDTETGIYVDCNPAAVHIYEYATRDEVIGKTPLDVSAPIQYNGAGSADEAAKHIRACLENGSHIFEWRHQRPNGQIWDADVHLMSFQYRGKQLMQFTLQDITERKKADQALRESEIKFRTLFESASDAILLMEQDVFIDCNQKTLEMFGCTREQLIGHTPYLFSPELQPDGRDSILYSQEKIDAALAGEPQLFEWKHCRYDKTLFDAEVTLNRFSAADKSYLQVIVHDVSERKNIQEKMQYLAMHDSLTGLPNRSMFTELLKQSILSAKRHKRQLAVFFIDLDRFKIINDTKGHDAGDQMLQEIAVRYTQSLRASDVVCRQGGDEFVILIEDFHNLSDLEIIAGKIIASTLKPIALLGDECRVTASIGISIYPKDGEDEQSLMKHADMAMYFAKEEGKNNFQFYSADIHLQSMERLAIETNLRLALERNELSLHYQAKVNFKTGGITGVEALLRWQNQQLGSVTPTQFIPVAEETGIIISIGKWVLKTACAQNVAWQQQGLPSICMAVNLSLRQLTDNNLINDIKNALSDSGMAPNLLELEITESMIMSNPKKIIDVLAKIKSMGVRLSIDDFGTGYSSLGQLKHFPVDTLKIDRSFIRNIPGSAEDAAITHAIITMGETLGLTIVAEGVETIEQMNYLKEQSCDEMQGYYFSRPIEPDLFAQLLREQTSNDSL